MASIRAVHSNAATAKSLHHRRSSSKASADISERDERLLNAKEEVQHDSLKSLIEAPKSSDLMGWYSVACLIVNRMIGMMHSIDGVH